MLTDDAVRFKGVADQVLRSFDNAIGDLQAISKSHRGHVRIGAAPSMIVHVVTPALAAFRSAFPNISISVRDGGSDRIERAVLDGDVDFGIASRLHNFPELSYVPILTDPFGVIFPQDHPLSDRGDRICWADLAPYDYIALTNDTGIGAFLEAYPELGLKEKSDPYDHASSTTSLYAMLSLGGKISVLPAMAAHASALQQFRFVELCEPSMSREICLVTRHLRSFSANTRRILEVLMQTIKDGSHLNGARPVEGAKWTDATVARGVTAASGAPIGETE